MAAIAESGPLPCLVFLKFVYLSTPFNYIEISQQYSAGIGKCFAIYA